MSIDHINLQLFPFRAVVLFDVLSFTLVEEVVLSIITLRTVYLQAKIKFLCFCYAAG